MFLNYSPKVWKVHNFLLLKNLIGKQSLVSAIAGLFSVVVIWLFLMGPIERLNIDLLNYFFPSKANSDDVVVVAIDEQSFSAFDKQVGIAWRY